MPRVPIEERFEARRSALRGVYALVEPQRRESLAFVGDLLAGGVRLFQIRAKSGIARAELSAIVGVVRAAGGLTLVNDDVDAARDADGVHLGQEDAALVDLPALRRSLAGRVIGLSCGTPAQARSADPELVDYIGVGPLRATVSKADAGLPIGVSGIHAVVRASLVPAAAIGGILLADIRRVRETGAVMGAVGAALAGASDVKAMARAFVTAWDASPIS